MRYGTRCARAAAVCLLAILGGCDLLGPRVCTTAGCVNSLTVSLRQLPTSAFRVEARAAGSTEVQTIECPDPARCGTELIFRRFMPGSVTITVATARGTTSQEVRPSYSPYYPNGRRCGPACRRGKVQVAIPAE